MRFGRFRPGSGVKKYEFKNTNLPAKMQAFLNKKLKRFPQNTQIEYRRYYLIAEASGSGSRGDKMNSEDLLNAAGVNQLTIPSIYQSPGQLLPS